MIKTNKRRPGIINNTPMQPRSRVIRSQENSMDGRSIIARFESGDDHILCERNDEYVYLQDTKKKSSQEKELYLLDLSSKGIANLELLLDRDIQLQRIYTLNLGQNCIKSFPSSIFNRLVNLRELCIQQNNIEKISFPYFRENYITRVNISKNRLVSLNLQHLEFLTHLQCRQNNISFITLPRSLKYIDCSNNKLSNVYSLENCVNIQEINFSGNLLYDLKFNFKPYIKVKDEIQEGEENQIKYKYLKHLDCSFNKIQHLEGFINIVNINVLILNSNKIAITRNIINQILVLQNLQQLELSDNPIETGGYTEMEIVSMFSGKLVSLKILNGEAIEDKSYDINFENSFNSSKKSQFSLTAEEPYRLFLQSQRKDEDVAQIPRNLQWNFTLGDCENELNHQAKITDLSEISEYHTCINETQIERQSPRYESTFKCHKQNSKRQLSDIQKSQQKEIKIKIVKSSQAISVPHHIHYQPFLKALLPMSYIPASPVLSKSIKITSRRLDEEDDDFILILKMFMNRGGVVYLKKIVNWIIQQNEQDIFNRHCQGKNLSQMGFLLNEINQKQFKELSKFNKLVPRQKKDIIGMQPNVFSCFHLIVRFTPNRNQQFYNCVYLLQSTHL